MLRLTGYSRGLGPTPGTILKSLGLNSQRFNKSLRKGLHTSDCRLKRHACSSWLPQYTTAQNLA